MSRLRTVFLVAGLAMMFVLVVGFDAFPWRWLVATSAVEAACLMGVWATTYAMRHN